MRVAALGPDGLVVPMPSSVPVTTQQVIHASLLELVVPDDVLPVIEAWERAVQSGADHARVRLLADPDRPVMVHFADVRHRYGVFLRFIVGQHIAEGGGSVRTEIRPRLSIWRKDERAVIVEVDEAATPILGWRRGELVGQRSVEFIHPDDHQRAIATWMDMLSRPQSKQRVRLRHRHRDGSWIWFEVTNHNLINDPDRRCVDAEMIDISDEMAAHEALRASEQLLRRLTEALPLGVLQVDVERRIVYRNDRLVAIVGVSDAATVDEQFAGTAAVDRPMLDDAVRAVLAEGRDADLQLTIGHPDDAVRACSVRMRALNDESGAVTGAILAVSDVTEDARLRQELEQRATFDALTLCHNRAATIHALERTLSQRRRADAGVAVVFFDLDHFKEVNDRFGHAAGDEVLAHFASGLLGAARAGDMVGRLGGDEFLVVCEAVPSPDEAFRTAMRFAASAAAAGDGPAGDTRITPRASVGVAWSRGDEDADALVARADAAMYQSKTNGDGRPVLALPTLRAVPSEHGTRHRRERHVGLGSGNVQFGSAQPALGPIKESHTI